MYRIVASDLDGTLLNPDHRLSDYTKEILQALRQQQIHFVFATGRHHIDVAQMRDNVGIDAYMITSNGARVHSSDGALILSQSIQHDIAVELAQIAMHDPLVLTHIYRGDDWLINKEDAYSLSFFEESSFRYQLFNPKDFLTDDIAKMYFTTIDDNQHTHLACLKRQIEDRLSDSVSLAFSTVNCLEVMAAGVSKGMALDYVATLLGYKLTDTIAFGDGMNDYEMLFMAGKGCIMQNAPKILKTQLPHLEVIGSNAHDAVPHYLENLFLK